MVRLEYLLLLVIVLFVSRFLVSMLLYLPLFFLLPKRFLRDREAVALYAKTETQILCMRLCAALGDAASRPSAAQSR